MKLIAGLGNKGKEYNNTRHNIGFIFLDYFADKAKIQFNDKNKLAIYTLKNISGERIIFIKPQTYMNLSGQAIKFFMDRYKINISDILVIHDDIDLNLAKIKIKKGGSDAGHNGIKSIIQEVGDGNFCRIRIGIGRPKEKGCEADFVLAKFSDEEKNELEKKFPIIENFIYNWISLGYEKAASKFKDE
ncbi:MAG: aminoacyl-tRNA hydrolase [Candidatus Goldbacteria bacterium]|nr:aminoacyl-tRNA hydrolase [Candidatus Goldiibacteriota bacterium]